MATSSCSLDAALLVSYYRKRLQAAKPLLKQREELLYLFEAPQSAGKPKAHRAALDQLIATDHIRCYRYIHGDLRQPVVLAVVDRPVPVDG